MPKFECKHPKLVVFKVPSEKESKATKFGQSLCKHNLYICLLFIFLFMVVSIMLLYSPQLQ